MGRIRRRNTRLSRLDDRWCTRTCGLLVLMLRRRGYLELFDNPSNALNRSNRLDGRISLMNELHRARQSDLAIASLHLNMTW